MRDERRIDNEDLVTVRVDMEELGSRVYAQELERRAVQTNLLAYFASGSVFQGLSRLHRSARQTPSPIVRSTLQEDPASGVEHENARTHQNQWT